MVEWIRPSYRIAREADEEKQRIAREADQKKQQVTRKKTPEQFRIDELRERIRLYFATGGLWIQIPKQDEPASLHPCRTHEIKCEIPAQREWVSTRIPTLVPDWVSNCSPVIPGCIVQFKTEKSSGVSWALMWQHGSVQSTAFGLVPDPMQCRFIPIRYPFDQLKTEMEFRRWMSERVYQTTEFPRELCHVVSSYV
jgi:hypothetical protein